VRVAAGRVGFVFHPSSCWLGSSAAGKRHAPAELSGRADAREPRRAMLVQVGLEARLGHYPPQLWRRAATVALARPSPPNRKSCSPTSHRQPRRHHRQRIIELMFRTHRKPRHYAGAGHARHPAGAVVRADVTWRRETAVSCLRPLRPSPPRRQEDCAPSLFSHRSSGFRPSDKKDTDAEIHRAISRKYEKTAPRNARQPKNKVFSETLSSGK